MKKKKLFVFLGKIGAGKTTLIKEAFEGVPLVDVKPFVRAYWEGDTVPEEKTLQAYQDMYVKLKELEDPEVVVELGTNHNDYNIRHLKVLSQQRLVHLFLCIASVETLRQRLEERTDDIPEEAREKRLAVDFPNSHLPLIEAVRLPYTILDMEQPWTDNVILVHQRIRDL